MPANPIRMPSISAMIVLALTIVVASSVHAPAQAAACIVGGLDAPSDFNDDGYSDLAIGAPYEDIGSENSAGSVNVVYGSAAGLQTASPTDQIFYQGQGLGGTAEAGDLVGYALATGDFNRDGCDDLAIGAPGEAIGSTASAGWLGVLYGSSNGLTATGNQAFWQGNAGMVDTAETADLLGWTLAAGDFNGNGYDDLAIGVPFEDIGTIANTGIVTLLYGGTTGLTTTGNHLVFQGNAWDAVPGVSEAGDFFGTSLASADFDADGKDDLAVGVPAEDVSAAGLEGGSDRNNAGAVVVLKGGTKLAGVAGSPLFTQAPAGGAGPGLLETGDAFGNALAAGDFNGDDKDDLAVGAPTENEGPFASAGSVSVLLGGDAANLIGTTGAQYWTQSSPDIYGVSEEAEWFGNAMSAGDFDGDGVDDLAVGAPNESIQGATQAGAVNVLFGSSSLGGLSEVDNQLLVQGGEIPAEDASPQNDQFGSSVAAGDFNGDGRSDVAAGAPSEDIGGSVDAGAVNVWHGSTSRVFVVPTTHLWHQDTIVGGQGVEGNVEAGDKFGFALSGKR